ncbi:neuraminidase-like domain-containing protein, partial [Alkalinema sp. FACHB-956]|uniref:neuraminidase-like domain-containing protein n=1 Tax=Alkalinema sp. FACHB-956 TaxID=2692768 RepID=UPI0018EFB0FB
MVDIRINTNGLTPSQFFLPELTTEILEGANELSLQLEPREYTFQIPQHLGLAASFKFQITPNGLIDYDPIHTFLRGRGTTTLTVQGFPITFAFDARSPLSHDLMLNGAKDVILSRTQTHHSLNLIPGTGYSFRATPDTIADFSFHVDPNGEVKIAEQYKDFAKTDGNTLTISGYSITIDGRALSHDLRMYLVGNDAILPHTQPHPLTLIPTAGYTFWSNFRTLMDFRFDLSISGEILLNQPYRDLATVQERTLTLRGHRITLDAQAFSYDLQLSVVGDRNTLPRGQRHELTLMPSARYSFEPTLGVPANFEFDLDVSGQIAINSRYKDFAVAQERSLLLRHLVQEVEESLRTVSGRISLDNGQPLKNMIVRAFHEGEQATVRLGEDSSDAEGRYTIRYEPLPGITRLILRVIVSDAQRNELKSSDRIQTDQPLTIVNLIVPQLRAVTYQVTGKVSSPVSAGVEGLRVLVVDKAVGEDVTLVATTTQSDGAYQATFPDTLIRQRGKTQPDLQVRVFQGDRFLAASEVRYNASPSETLNVFLDHVPPSALQSEYEILLHSLAPHFQGHLRDLQETDTRHDITYLANKTGWDARAVAIAALADEFSTRSQIQPAFFYALFRAGLSANNDAVYQIDAKTVERIWKQSIQQGVIPATLEAEVPQAIQRFQELFVQRSLDAPAITGVSSLKEMLSSAHIHDEDHQKEFVTLYAQHQDNLSEFWKAIRTNQNLAPVAQRLQIDGQLAYLTLNNAPLIQKLHTQVGNPNELTTPLSLIEHGYYQAEPWETIVEGGAIPTEIPGQGDEQKKQYAELMAAHLRLSYPTAVVAQMVRTDETPLQNPLRKDDVSHLLMTHQGQFEIGMQPIEQFALQNNLQIAPDVIQEVTRIQRAHQITSSDRAMNILLNHDLDSAYKVVQYSQADFVQQFKDELGGEAKAILVHAKAQQVHNTVLNIAVSYLTGRNAIAIGSNPEARIIDTPYLSQPAIAAANATDVIAYPTLEKLFGEMDYCACDHCRSILSPAAYLVNLLQFCDRPPEKEQANNQNSQNPQTVLLRRRPDIEHLPLTCENTNTPLPYIDIVNETLEYFITHNLNLANYTGHDIKGDVTSEELLASPQFVSATAYQILAGNSLQDGPLPLLPPMPPLPFHQPLEYLRRYFNQFEIPLPTVMQALRKTDNLEPVDPTTYGWRDILMEELHLSHPEYARLSDRTLSLYTLYGYHPDTPEAEILSTLANVKAFTRRVGISYEEIIEIIQTRFVNPNAHLIPKLERLYMTSTTLKAFKEGLISDDEFDKLLPTGLDANQYGGDIKAWVRNDQNYAKIMGLITLTNPTTIDDLSRFDVLEFRYANPDHDNNGIRAFEFVRLIRFIHLWKKLGWTIAQTDQAIAALYPADQTPNDPDDAVNLQRLDAGFRVLLPRLGIIQQVMRTLNLSLTKDLLPLLACFSPIDTFGKSLYHQMFLNPALLKQDPIFADDGYGNFLTHPADIGDHIEALRAALQLTEDELRQIMADLSYTDTTPLSLDTLSAIFRRGWLAHTLKLSLREFLLLTQFTGLDPFAAPDPVHPPIQRLIQWVRQLQTLAVKPVQVLYLIWNQDITGKAVPRNSELLGFARSLRSALTEIEREYILTDDPEGQIARSRMALVYGSQNTDLFFSFLENTFVSTVPYGHPQDTLAEAIVNATANRITYDNFRKQLSFTGILTSTLRDALNAVPDVSSQFRTAINDLYRANQNVIQPFFDRYPELHPHYVAYTTSNESIEKKRANLLASILPALKRQRKQQQALQLISATTTVEAEFATALLANPLVLHANADPVQPAMVDLLALEIPNSLTHAWNGYLETPENGLYNLAIDAGEGATVTLTLDGSAIALTQNATLWRNAQPLQFRAGTLYKLALAVENLQGSLKVSWQTLGRGWEVIPADYLYADAVITPLQATYLHFLKVTNLAIVLKLTPQEIAYLGAHADYHIDGQGWLNHLSTAGNPNAVHLPALHQGLTALLDFAHLKAELSPDDQRLLRVLTDPIAAAQPEPDQRLEDCVLFRLTGWQPRSLEVLLQHLGLAIADLTHLHTFRRIFDAYAPLHRLKISAAALIKATTNEPTATTVRDLQAALRARYDESAWLNVLKPINDEMRGLQRDALVAYILHQMRSHPNTAHINTPDKLFEYFLMDVQMEPCMQTSRIRHAISSVQLFIERCLMNLEPSVCAASINAKQWTWMKRYRVWEANRKVFLYPENWLEPELRDDQSPFFKEAMSELLQGDITEDRAATTLLNYLAKLEEVAKLEPCGIHFVENDVTKLEDDVAHVVARTAGANRKYFYRRREFRSWTPWEQIKLDIEDNPAIPVVWNDRLFLFWLRIVKQPLL